MNTGGKLMLCVVCLCMVSFSTLQAESVTLLYDIDFNGPVYTVGQPLVYGPFIPVCKTIQDSYYCDPNDCYFSDPSRVQYPIIIDSFGDLNDQPCLFEREPDQEGGYFESEIQLDTDKYYLFDVPVFPRYIFEMDMYVESLEDAEFELQFEYTDFKFSGDTITDEQTDATVPLGLGQVMHLLVEFNFETNLYTFSIDDVQIFSGSIYYTYNLTEVEFGFYTYNVSTSDAQVAIDNLVLYGVHDEPVINITEPSGGFGFTVGNTYPIQWYSSSDVQDVMIEYSKDAGSTWQEVSPPNMGNMGVYYWTIPNTPANVCKLRLTDSVTGAVAESVAFRICQPVPQMPPYDVIYLDEVFGDYAFVPTMMNDHGDFIGKHAWVNGDFMHFENYGLEDINNQKQILLEDFTGTEAAYAVWKNGIATHVSQLENFPEAIRGVLDINNQGHLLVERYGYQGPDFIWADGEIHEINDPVELDYIEPMCFNDYGQVAGEGRQSGGGDDYLFTWDNGEYCVSDFPVNLHYMDPIKLTNSGALIGTHYYYGGAVFMLKDCQYIDFGEGDFYGANDQDVLVVEFDDYPVDYPPYEDDVTQIINGAERFDLRQLTGLPENAYFDLNFINNNNWMGGDVRFRDENISSQDYPVLLVPHRERTLVNAVIVGPEIVYEDSTVSFRAVGVSDDNCPMALGGDVTYDVYPPEAGIMSWDGYLEVGDLEGIDQILVTAEYEGDQTFRVFRYFTAHAPAQLYVPTDYPTIQAAIDAALDGDEIILEDGVYRGQGNRDIEIVKKEITIRSLNGAEFCTIDPQGIEAYPHFGLNLSAGQKAVCVEGITITNAYPAIICGSYANNVVFNECVIRDNNGNGIEDCYGVFNHCKISNNAGYGIYEGGGRLYHCDISNNREGGLYRSSATVVNSTIRNNSGYGLETCNWAHIKNSVISGNTTGLSGTYWTYGQYATPEINIDNCIIAGNTNGARNPHNVTFTNSIFYGNRSHAIYSYYSTIPILNNCLFYDNGQDIYQRREVPADNSQSEVRTFDGADEINTLSEATGTLSVNPLFIEEGYYSSRWVDGDYHLSDDSPCIDAGMILEDHTDADIDPDGIVIPRDGDGDGQRVVDVGIYEYMSKKPVISVSESEIQLYGSEEGFVFSPVEFEIGNEGIDLLAWSIDIDAAWLKADSLTGTVYSLSSDPVSLTADMTGLTFGEYTGCVTISGQDAINSHTITVTLTVGEILHVPVEYSTIQDAIDVAQNGDTVMVADGTYTGDGNRDIDFLGKTIVVKSENGPARCVIDCQGTEADPHRAFVFHSGETRNSIVSGFKIVNGVACFGTIEIEHNNIMNSITTSFGAAIFCNQASPSIVNCIFQNCNSSRNAVIDCFKSSPMIRDVLFVENASHCVIGRHGNPVISSCQFIGNDCGQTMNLHVDYAGYIIEKQGTGAVTFVDGEGIVENCVFSGNKGGMYAGGISVIDAKADIDHCTFDGNRGETSGTLFFLNEENIQSPQRSVVNHCIFRDNQNIDGVEVLTGTGYYGYGIAPTAEIFYEVNYSCVEALDARLPGIGNIDADPLFVQSGYWDPNGTVDYAYDDFWVQGDYHLQSEGWRWDVVGQQWTWDDVTSPCIDAGNPGMSLADEPMVLDVDLLGRFGENVRLNMGAYGGTAQASMAPPGWALLCDLDNDKRVDVSDLMPMIDTWLMSGQDQPADVSRDGTVGLADFALLAAQWML